MNELEFDSFKQLQIFFLLINNPKGLNRDTIVKILNIPRTTIYDNLSKLMKRYTNDNFSYVKSYSFNNYKVGRPITIFYISKHIKNKFMVLNILKIKINGIIINISEIL